MDAIREKAPAFIEKRLVDIQNSIIFTQEEKQRQNDSTSCDPQDTSTITKQTAFSINEKPTTPITSKVWSDPPPRKAFIR